MTCKHFGLSFLISLSLGNFLLASECHEKMMVKNLDHYAKGKLDSEAIHELAKLAAETPQQSLPLANCGQFPLLFERYPAMKTKIAYLPLCNLPTPIVNCDRLAANQGIVSFYVKDDGQSGNIEGQQLFGGNKPRKLEFLFGDVLLHSDPSNRDTTILARGGTGTNFGTAAAMYANYLGVKCILVLCHQPNSHTVQRNIRLMKKAEAILRVAPAGMFNMVIANEFLRVKQETGKFPYLFRTGGSNARGALGFVNAVLELQKQIGEHLLKKPDFIYVAVGNGSGGTVAGLLLGMQVFGLDGHLVAVHVEPEDRAGEVVDDLKILYKETNELLNAADPNFPIFEFPSHAIIEVKEFCGKEYGLTTQEALDARKLLYETHRIELDGTYVGKTLAGALGFIKKNSLHQSTHLLWNSYCSHKFEDEIKNIDIDTLPYALKQYFKTPIQPLDVKF